MAYLEISESALTQHGDKRRRKEQAEFREFLAKVLYDRNHPSRDLNYKLPNLTQEERGCSEKSILSNQSSSLRSFGLGAG